MVAEVSQEPGIRECLQWFTREKSWINDQHLQICRVPAPTFFEQKRAEWMLAQFQALGYDAKIDRAGNVVAFPVGARRDAPLLALTAHLDTVLSARNSEEVHFAPDGRLLGPGVSDNGAGLTALIALARGIRTFPDLEAQCGPLVFVANVGEEGEGNLSGMRYLCRQSPLADRLAAFLILDGPATEHITSQALASRRFDVTFTGPGGHSWSDFGIGNPVHALSRAITFFTYLRVNGNGGPRSSFNFGRSILDIFVPFRDYMILDSLFAFLLGEVHQFVGALDHAVHVRRRTKESDGPDTHGHGPPSIRQFLRNLPMETADEFRGGFWVGSR